MYSEKHNLILAKTENSLHHYHCTMSRSPWYYHGTCLKINGIGVRDALNVRQPKLFGQK